MCKTITDKWHLKFRSNAIQYLYLLQHNHPAAPKITGFIIVKRASYDTAMTAWLRAGFHTSPSSTMMTCKHTCRTLAGSIYICVHGSSSTAKEEAAWPKKQLVVYVLRRQAVMKVNRQYFCYSLVYITPSVVLCLAHLCSQRQNRKHLWCFFLIDGRGSKGDQSQCLRFM